MINTSTKSQMVSNFVKFKLQQRELEYPNTNNYAYMTGYLESLLSDIANAKNIKQVQSILDIHLKSVIK